MESPEVATWLVERTGNPRFPFRISIESDGRTVLAVRAKSVWPGPGQNIFCLREQSFDPAEPVELIERVPVATFTRVGRKLSVVLDRSQRKRCEFLVVEKPRAGGGTHEQVFFRTESGIRAHRSKSRVELRAAPEALSIVIDSAERYPWRFPNEAVTRRKMPVGDYGLLVDQRLLAVVERKSYDNLLGDVGAIQALHHQLADLASVPYCAFVIEAEYRDFLDPSRLAGRWPAAHMARVLGELSAMHPRLPIVFAGNRASANAWTHQYFRSVAGRQALSPQLALAMEARVDTGPRQAGLDEQVRRAVLDRSTGPVTVAGLAAQFPHAGVARIRRVLGQLRSEGLVRCTGRGRGATWVRIT